MSEKLNIKSADADIKKDVEAVKNDDSIKSAEQLALTIDSIRRKQAEKQQIDEDKTAPIVGVDMIEIRPEPTKNTIKSAETTKETAKERPSDADIKKKLEEYFAIANKLGGTVPENTDGAIEDILKEVQDAEINIAKAKETEMAKARELEENVRAEIELDRQTEMTADNIKSIMAEEANEKELSKNLETPSQEQIEAWKAELAGINQQIMAQDSRQDKLDKLNEAHPDRLVAITADWTHDKHEMAHDLAEQALNAEAAKDGLIKKIWKGTLFKKYYEQKYANEYLEGKRTDENGRNLYDIIRSQHDDVVERFVKGATEDLRYIHEKIGQKDKNGNYHGEKLVEADEKTNEQIKYAIEQYARYKLKLGEKESDIDTQFENQMGRVIQEAIDDGRLSDGAKTNNYLAVAKEAAKRYQEVAKNAKNAAEHKAAMAEVMAGFQVYNAEVRNNARTETHRDNIDKIVNKIESSKLGRFIPSEIVAGAAGVALGLTQTGARAVFGIAGGVIASSAIAGLRERNRITEDRARMLRDVASGESYSKNSEHEVRIGGTLYDLKKATDLTNRINEAMNPENVASPMELFQALAEARVRIDFSDHSQKDLIAYSSPDKRGKERLELDEAVIRLEKTLNEDEKATVDALKAQIKKSIFENIDEKDAKFKNYRAAAAAKRAGKTLALGAVASIGTYFASQEIMAAVDSNKIGLFEKLGWLKTENAADAKETVLASGFGFSKGKYEIPGAPSSVTIKNVSDPNEIARYEAEGYSKFKIANGTSETKQILTEVDPSASSARVNVKYDAWAAGGTKDLRFRLNDGSFTSNVNGNVVTSAGENINYSPENLKAFITVGDSKFEIAGSINEAGQMTWGENGVFTTTTGETIRGIGENGEKLYRYFEIAAENGTDASDGLRHIIPLATDTGANTFSDKITQVVEETIESPAVYNLYKAVPGESTTVIRDVAMQGLSFIPPVTARNGLGGVARAESAEFRRWNSDILREIENNSELLGGSEGIGIITDRSDLDQATSDRYSAWWNNLSENGKNFVSYLMNQIESSNNHYDMNWGNGFQTWFAANA